MNELIELTAFVDKVTESSTNAVIGVVKMRKAYLQGARVSLSFLNNNQWYRSLTKEEKKRFRHAAMLYITA